MVELKNGIACSLNIEGKLEKDKYIASCVDVHARCENCEIHPVTLTTTIFKAVLIFVCADCV